MKLLVCVYLILELTQGIDFLKMSPYSAGFVRLSHKYRTVGSGSLGICFALCHHDCQCLAVSYNDKIRKCELNNKSGLDKEYNFTTDEGWNLYQFVRGYNCPDGWYSFHRSCYRVSMDEAERRSWLNATDACALEGASLVKIETKEENSFIKEKLEELNFEERKYFWTAGNDQENEGIWLWAGDGSRVIEYTDWRTGEPNQYRGNEDCLGIYPPPSYGWNDFPCNYEYNYICEICR